MAATGLSICMLSLLGFPGTFGFIGKWLLLSSALAQGEWLLPLVAMIGSGISIGYYLPVVLAMIMKPVRTEAAHQTIRFPRPATAAIAFCVIAVIVLGFWPNPVVNFAAQKAVQLSHTAVLVFPR